MIERKKMHLKNMVCPRCISAVELVMEKLEISFVNLELGEIDLKHVIDDELRQQLNVALEEIGFWLVDDHKSRIIVQMKI